MSIYLLLGAKSAGGGEGTWYPFKVIHITDKESAQNVPAPVTTYALFRDGQFLTQSIQSDKNSWRWQVYKIDFTPLFLSRNIMLSNEMEKKE